MSRDANALLRTISGYRNAPPHNVRALRKCIEKKRYATMWFARIGLWEQATRFDKEMVAYYCIECNGYHIATAKPKL